MRRVRACVGTTLVLGLALSASGGGTPQPRSRGGPCPVDSSCDDPQGFVDRPVRLPGATRGGTVTVLTHDGITGTLDPAVASATDVTSIPSGPVTRSLTQWRYDGEGGAPYLAADLSVTLGEHNDDFTQWAFTMRRGVRFEGASLVTARSVARGVRRCLVEDHVFGMPVWCRLWVGAAS